MKATLPFLVTLIFTSVTQAALVHSVQWSVSDGGNGHYYEIVAVPGSISWQAANQSAIRKGGYLATLTSAQENEFLFDLINSDPFWVTLGRNSTIGPWLGGYQLLGSVEPNRGWTWVTGETFRYQNWDTGVPDNENGFQNYLHFGYSVPRSGKWNDLEDDGRNAVVAYVVEYNDIPEPTTTTLAVLGLLGLCRSRKR